MKRIILGSIVAVMLVLLAVVIVRADAGGRHGWCGHRWHHPEPMSFLARDLKLSHGQKAQIRVLWQAERPTLAANIRDLLAENKAMDAIAAKDNPDPGEVQKIADREANTIAAMLMEKARLESKIDSTVLSREQRARAEELQKKWESRLDRLAGRLETQPAEK